MSIPFTATAEDVNGVTLVRLPQEASLALPSRGLAMAKVSTLGKTLVAPLEPDGKGGHWLALEGLPVQPGQSLAVELTPTDDWPEPPAPRDLLGAVEAAGLQDWWDSLTTKARWEWLRWLRNTNNAATRQKRVGVAISKMQGGMRRPCCFNTAGCTVPEVSKSGKLIG